MVSCGIIRVKAIKGFRATSLNSVFNIFALRHPFTQIYEKQGGISVTFSIQSDTKVSRVPLTRVQMVICNYIFQPRQSVLNVTLCSNPHYSWHAKKERKLPLSGIIKVEEFLT
jgi:hypothetical protein